MDRQEIGVRRQHPDAVDPGAVIAIALPITIETRSAGAPYEPAQNWERVSEKRPTRLQFIVAALLIVVAERRKDRRGRKILLELLPEELHRLSHKDAIGGIRMVLRRGIEFPAEAMCEEISGYQYEGRLRQCLRHLSHSRAEQHPIAVPPVSAEAAVTGAIEHRAPLFGLRGGQLVDQ